MTPSSIDRIEYWDGLRGLMAMVVVFEHFIRIAFPTLLTGTAMWFDNMTLGETLTYGVLTLPYAGSWAVAVFFILSGYVLTKKHLPHHGQKKAPIIADIPMRYVRLMVPFAAALLVFYVLNIAGLTSHRLLRQVNSFDHIEYFPFDPSLRYVLQIAFVDSLRYLQQLFVPQGWTLTPEFWGSIAIFAAMALVDDRKSLLGLTLVAIIAALYVGGPNANLIIGYLAVLFVGSALAQIESLMTSKQKIQVLTQYKKWEWLLLPISIAVLLYFGSNIFRGVNSNPFHGWIRDTWPSISTVIIALPSAVITFLLVWRYRVLQAALESRVMQYLGKRSFAIYLMHFNVLVVVVSGVIYVLASEIGVISAAVVAWFVYIPCVLLASEAFYRLVDKPVMQATRAGKGRLVALMTRTPPQPKEAVKK